jgi:nucleoside-diphosphate-sugar epimerase
MGRGTGVVPVVRDAARWEAVGLGGVARVADLGDAAALRAALAEATSIVSCAHARHAGAIIEAAPSDARLVFLGSTRKFTHWPDAHGLGVLAGEAAFLASGRRGVMLHPTMIYGAQGEDNVQRLAALLRRLPVVPLPGGGRALVQPIHQDDVTACIVAALKRDWGAPETLVVAGGEAPSYADFVRAVAAWAGLRPRPVVPVPAWAMRLGAALLGLVPGLPGVGRDEMRRLLEDKAFDIAPMRDRLGVEPLRLVEGLARVMPGPGLQDRP